MKASSKSDIDGIETDEYIECTDDVTVKPEVASDRSSSSSEERNRNEDGSKRTRRKKIAKFFSRDVTAREEGEATECSSQRKRRRGRPKEPPRAEGCLEDSTSEDETEAKRLLQRGIGYPVEFKLKVLKYADTHSTTATAEKFGLQPVRVRDWKRARVKIEDESKGSRIRRARPDGFTVAEKLQAVAFATERSIDEARLLYDVDRHTIGKWKAKKDELEARLERGEGDRMTSYGPGRKPRYTAIEEGLRNWIVAIRLKGISINYKMILNKAKALMSEEASLKNSPVPRTYCWVTAFLKRNNLHGLLGNTFGHEDPKELLKAQFDTSDLSSKTFVNEAIDIPDNPNKRTKRTITLEDKVKIIRRIEQGEAQGTVAKSLKMATSTVQTIWSCRDELLKRYLTPKSKTRSNALVWKEYKCIGVILKDWYDENFQKGVFVDLDGLMSKAKQLADIYKLSQFSSEGKQWLKIFCKKHELSAFLAELRSSSRPLCSSQNLVVDSPSHSFSNSYHVSHSTSAEGTAKTEPAQVVTSNAQLHSVSSESASSYSTSPNPPPDIVKCYNLLRSWIQSECGPHEYILNSQLSLLEATMLHKGNIELT